MLHHVRWLASGDAQQKGITVREQTQILIDPETNRFRGYILVDLKSGEPDTAKVLLDTGLVDQPGQTP